MAGTEKLVIETPKPAKKKIPAKFFLVAVS